MTPRATYRLQFTRDFPFAAAQAIVPYLAKLGISHVYASPVTMARSGSTHGYDVIDPTRINPELGGEDGLRALADALHAHDMGLIIDIVPNHMGVAGGENPYWNDVLRLGRDSPFAGWFDIDWDRGPLVLPLLGAPLSTVIAAGDLSVVPGDGDAPPHLLLYGDQRLPLSPATPALGPDSDLTAILAAQPYRLIHWRAANDSLNWRRFFSINELAGLRVEDPAVFDATHRLYLDLLRDRVIDGLRVDHVDGLTDPAGYCRTLRAALDAVRPGPERAYLVVEKILGADEPLDPDWGVDGTSGYDAMRDFTALLHDPSGEAPLRALWQDLAPDQADPAAVVTLARQQMLAWQFEAQLDACVDAFAALARSAQATHPALEAVTPAMLRRAIERLLWVFPVYRTYGDGKAAPASDAPVRQRAWDAVQPHLPPGEAWIARQVLDWLSGEGPGTPALAARAVTRFQQLSAPIAAKGVEDTAFYRHAPLLSANDVGSDPDQFAIAPDQFHHRVQARAAAFPLAMLATATHDHKRGEDMRARLAVLSAVPDLWAQAQARWAAMADATGIALHPADRYQLFQTLFGAWPQEAGATPPADFAARIAAWLEKALREARLRSSWEAPDTAYEDKAQALARALLDSAAFGTDMAAFVARLSPAAQANSLTQTALKYCIPGVPDLYQGTELTDLSLVDPDNRRPVDYAARAALLDGPEAACPDKLALIAHLLGHRRDCPDLFTHGAYHPLHATGLRAAHILAFERTLGSQRLRCAVLIRAGAALVDHGGLPPADWWGDTALGTPDAPLAAEIFAHRTYLINLDKQRRN